MSLKTSFSVPEIHVPYVLYVLTRADRDPRPYVRITTSIIYRSIAYLYGYTCVHAMVFNFYGLYRISDGQDDSYVIYKGFVPLKRMHYWKQRYTRASGSPLRFTAITISSNRIHIYVYFFFFYFQNAITRKSIKTNTNNRISVQFYRSKSNTRLNILC